MTDEQIKQNAEEYASENYHPYGSETNPQYLIVSEDSFIAGAHSRDEEIGRMNTTIRLYANQIALLRKEIDQLCNPWISVEERLPDAVDSKEFGHRRLSKQVLCVYEDGKCHVVRYDHNCNCWRWANGYGQMHEPKMWQYIDIPEGGTK